ncbi:glycerol-3-phosphate dehydrogenase [Rhodovulum sulfidophilum]|uniref:glycerol-3-phosphate dehydrogenase n=1 Tax=Rhodovulum sulfidophilum TaxID=35806 RepID=UPI0005A6E2AF|nr:glycerol-3-phosphate dehydrogenase [Rhodovulum sulfidophilum]ANB34104.1 glycerol-3-phosphate dehydrogenase [Rhodovulum sulfidophilum DSM 1374]ANB37926.1 glycerol-3-phosphate dehydrogenase [Rhodovulum sulfidophilum]MCW2301669.1 glycerol-3-phosphate dehydrogenase [Rhodovulum sulfidophilum]
MPTRIAEGTAKDTAEDKPADLLIVGGGINGCGIARDAAGRGLSVTLAEMDDLASATSSASTKLFHGGLRYLEYFEFRLVREALIERETLLSAMPHISWPMRFVLPLDREMRFDASTPASQLLSRAMPWMTGRRPAWLIRLGLFLYDHLGGRKILPPTRSLDLTTDPAGRPLKPRFRRAFEYSDCWVEDARLVALNARDAAERGAEILTRTRVVKARREDGLWTVTLRDCETGAETTRRARILVNAAGPWTADLIAGALQQAATDKVRLVRGSHIVTRRLFEHDRCYFFQGQDGRIVFAIPYETDFTLIGTTDAEHAEPDTPPRCTEEERDYLIGFVNRYLAKPVSAEDIVWTYSGVRPLHDEGEGSASAASRDYVIRLDRAGAPLVNIFGGKITTYRRLAETALEKIAEIRPDLPGPWTAGVALPGGDVAVDGIDGLIATLRQDYPFLTAPWARRLVRAYGTEARGVLGDAQAAADLGRDFGATLTEAELIWLMDREFARRAEDVVWRRSKLGLRLSPDQIARIDDWMKDRHQRPAPE